MVMEKRTKQDILEEKALLQERLADLDKQLDDITDHSKGLSHLHSKLDITDLSRKHLKELVDTAAIGILIFNGKGIVSFANDIASTMFKCDKDGLLGISLNELIPEEFRDNHEKHVKSYFENPTPRPMGMGWELMALRQDGKQFPIEISLNTLQSETGTYVVAFIKDITELKQHEMNFKTIIDTAAIGIIIVDNEGRITIANEQVAQFFGYTRTELLDLSVSELIPKEFRERHGQHLAAYFKNPISRPMGSGLELIGLKQDGTQFPLEISLSAIQAEELVLGVAFIVDITKRKQAEERFKMMIDTASVGVLVVQQGGKIVIANQLCANYFQYQQAELSNMSLEDLLPDEVRNNHKNYMEQFFSNPKPRPMGMGLELLAQKRDGTQFPVEISLSTVKVDDGVLGVAFIADITKRKQFEDQQFKAVEKLITDVGHDLKTPMAAITSRLHVLKYSLQEELHPHADVLEQHVRRLDKLIENLMIMARLDTRDNIPLTKSDLSLLLRFVVDDKQKDARNKHINLTHDIDDNLPDIYFNENFLFEALAHLVHNAIIFTSQGGAVHVCTENHDNTISIIISDTGVGIPEDQIPYIFDRFYRVDTSRPMDSALNGLGLAMVKRIIELHNGNINVKSVVGEGSTFEVILPKTP